MAKFKIVKKIDLSYLGEEWKDCYLSFNSPTFSDIKEMAKVTEEKNNEKIMNAGIKILEDAFVEGKAVSDKGEIVEVKKEEIIEFPVEVIVKSITELSGQPNPKV